MVTLKAYVKSLYKLFRKDVGNVFKYNCKYFKNINDELIYLKMNKIVQ